MAKFKPLPPFGEQHKADNKHPIPPLSLELVEQWCNEDGDAIITSPRWFQIVCTKAARWGWEQRGDANEAELQKARDEELEACEEWLNYNYPLVSIHHLRDARRPKPPSLSKLALEALNEAVVVSYDVPPEGITKDQENTIRRALERLREHEQQVEAHVND